MRIQDSRVVTLKSQPHAFQDNPELVQNWNTFCETVFETMIDFGHFRFYSKLNFEYISPFLRSETFLGKKMFINQAIEHFKQGHG